MNKLKIDEYKYRLSHSAKKVGGAGAIGITLLGAGINHALHHSGKSLNQDIMLLLLSGGLGWFITIMPFLKSWKDDELFEDYLIQKEKKITERKKKLQESIQNNIMHNFEEKLDEEISNIMDNNTPAEMEKARHDLFVLNMQMDYIEGKIDTIYKLQKRIKNLIRNKK